MFLILFIHQLQCVHRQSTSLVSAHNFSAVLSLFVALLERILWGAIEDLRYIPLDVFC
jgi:hypothetical protein